MTACANLSAPIDVAELPADVREVLAAAWSPATRRTYAGAWRSWAAWCAVAGVQVLDARAVDLAAYLVLRARTRAVSTLRVDLAAIGQVWAAAGRERPATSSIVRLALKGIVRTSTRNPAPRSAISIGDLVAGLAGATVRNRALILVGFGAALRRSELVGLTLDDVEIRGDGLVVTVQRHKTGGAARRIGIPRARADRCPVAALEAWLAVRGPAPGRIFELHDRTVSRAVKRCAVRAGLDPRLYAGHSLRAGLATEAARAGAAAWSIQRQTGHASLGMLHRYIRDGELFSADNAARAALR